MYRKAFIDLYLKNGFDFEEAKNEVDFALETLFNYTYKDFMLGKTLEDWQISKFEKVLEERVTTHRPIQQIIGQAFFYGRRFFVNEHTLIPRPETEILVFNVLELSKNFENPKILDIGAGTGCIPITLMLENPDIIADTVDISAGAIEIARKNALFHNVLNNFRIIKSDLFENVKEKYDIIVSNPPYIPLKDKENLQIEVRDFDPPSALFTKDEEGLEYYKRITEKAQDFLNNNGFLAFEIGQHQAQAIAQLFEQNKFKVIKTEKDFNNIERVIIAQK